MARDQSHGVGRKRILQFIAKFNPKAGKYITAKVCLMGENIYR
jgi:hypothetical protein